MFQNLSVDSEHAAGDRLSEDGYDEDDEGEEEETEEDSLSSTEMVVSASMQFPLGQKCELGQSSVRILTFLLTVLFHPWTVIYCTLSLSVFYACFTLLKIQ